MAALSTEFESYRDRYETVRLTREDGILVITVHTGGKSMVWSATVHDELAACFAAVGADRGNKVAVLTGTGADFCGEIDGGSFSLGTAAEWDLIFYEGRKLLTNLLDIEIPMISAVNGPVRFHPEIPVMSDIVIASETALFQDATHFMSGIVPGDGAHVVWPHVLGPNRGRYFLLTGQELDAREAMNQGVVSEVLPPDRLMARAMELAAFVAAKPTLARRYSRVALTQRYKRLMQEGLSLGLAVEALAAIDHIPSDGLMKDIK